MEVTPHLKTVLKSYQHSATKSLHGPGLVADHLLAGGGGGGPGGGGLLDDGEDVVVNAVQVAPILSVADTTCSEVTETALEGESIACFDIGGETRLCLPQVLNSVLRDFDLLQINVECDQLNIYCSRCTPEQLTALKSHGILPSAAYSCGLIRKTDAQRLCAALLRDSALPFPSSKTTSLKPSFAFRVYHECFGRCAGLCYPGMFRARDARCVECLECRGAFSPREFVCHAHGQLEIRTLHWGFDSDAWRSYTRVCGGQEDRARLEAYLDEMRDRYLGKAPFPPREPVVEAAVDGLKRKQMHPNAPDLKLDEIALKKQHILDDYNPLPTIYAMPAQAHLDPHLLQCLQGLNAANRTLSAFKSIPVKDKPKLGSPKYRETGTNQPNITLVPPKKNRYFKQLSVIADELVSMDNNNTAMIICGNEVSSTKESGSPPSSKEISVIKHEKDYDRSPDSQGLIDSTVSVVQTTGCLNRYNSEIELSTDTDDSGSELNERIDCYRIENLLKDCVEASVRRKLSEAFRRMSRELGEAVRENQQKDNRIADLNEKIVSLENRIEELSTKTKPEEEKSRIKEDSGPRIETQSDEPNLEVSSEEINTITTVIQRPETPETIKIDEDKSRSELPKEASEICNKEDVSIKVKKDDTDAEEEEEEDEKEKKMRKKKEEVIKSSEEVSETIRKSEAE